MEPEVEFIGQRADGVKVVDGGGVDGPGVADDRDGSPARRLVRDDRGATGGDVEAMVRIDRHLAKGAAPHAHRLARLRGPAMRLRAAIDDQRRATPQPVFAHVPACLRDPRRQQAVEVRGSAAADQQPARRIGEAHQFAQPGDHLALDQRRRLVIAGEMVVHPRCEHLGEHPGRRSGPHHPAPEARVAVAGRIGEHIAPELLVHPVERHSRIGHRLVDPRCHVGRHRLPRPDARRSSPASRSCRRPSDDRSRASMTSPVDRVSRLSPIIAIRQGRAHRQNPSGIVTAPTTSRYRLTANRSVIPAI